MAKTKEIAPEFIEDEAPDTIEDAEESPGWLSQLLSAYESVTGAPTRAALMAPAKGENPLAAFSKQFGADPSTAPHGAEVAGAYGVGDQPITEMKVLPGVGGMVVGMAPALFGLSPADLSGAAIDLTASPDLLAGPAIRAGGRAVGALRGLGEVGAIGRSVPPAAARAVPAGVASVEKLNAEAIRQAAKELGVPAFEGQLNADKFTQRVEGILQDSPTIIGRGRQEKMRKAYEKTAGQVRRAMPGTAETKFNVGVNAKQDLLKAIEGEKEPLSKMYEALGESTRNMQIPPISKGRISKNVGKLEKFSGPAKSLAERVSKDILVIDNLDDVKRLKTSINQSLSATASPGERAVVSKISRRLKALEENTVLREAARFAKETQDPQAKQLIEALISERRTADKGWKEFMTGLSELSKGLGKKAIKTPYDAEKFISDLVPEQLVDRLSQKNNAGFIQFFSKKYPEQSKQIFALQKQRILTDATKDGVLNVNRVMKELDTFSPEAKKLMFSEQELKKLDAARTYVQSMPPKFNPSETATKGAFEQFFKDPINASTMTARDAALIFLLKSKGIYSPETFEAMKKAGMYTLPKAYKVQQGASTATRLKALGGGFRGEE